MFCVTALTHRRFAWGDVTPVRGPQHSGCPLPGAIAPVGTHLFTCISAAAVVGTGCVSAYRRSAFHGPFCFSGFPGTALYKQGGSVKLTALVLLCSLGGCGGRVREQTAQANVPESMNH